MDPKDLDLLKLWESILTGRSAPLSKWMRERYGSLGLNHIFTPSGFHLSAVLLPLMKIFRGQSLLLILGIGCLLSFFPGMGALKRMILIKGHQKIFGLKAGFCLGLLLDMLFGTFQNQLLSFTYSFLFLGIVYSGGRGIQLVLLFFFGQALIAYFQQSDISLLILLFSPLLNVIFAVLMPFLVILAIPLWGWQLKIGILLLKLSQMCVDISARAVSIFPSVEITSFTLFIFLVMYFRKKRVFLLSVLIFSTSLNLDLGKPPSQSKYFYRPQGKALQTKYAEKTVLVKFQDGSCRMNLVQGFWWENCSPRRRSSKRKKLKKLSYLLSGPQKSFLRG